MLLDQNNTSDHTSQNQDGRLAKTNCIAGSYKRNEEKEG